MKQTTKKISLNLPESWVKIVDYFAEREFTTRTQIIKNWIKEKCLSK